MGDWLKGKELKSYADYVAPSWAVPSDDWTGFNDFLTSPKRMEPATHASLFSLWAAGLLAGVNQRSFLGTCFNRKSGSF